MKLSIPSSVWTTIGGAAVAVLITVLAQRGCVSDAPVAPSTGGTSVVTPGTARDSVSVDSMRAVLRAEVRAEGRSPIAINLTGLGEADVLAKLDSAEAAWRAEAGDSTHSALVDSLRSMREVLAAAFGMVRRLQSQLRDAPFDFDFVAAHDTTITITELRLLLHAAQSYSYRDQSFGLALTAEQQTGTFFDHVATYLPWAGTLVAILKIALDAYKK